MANFNRNPDSHYHGLSTAHVKCVLELCRDNVADWKVGGRDAPFAIATVTLPGHLDSVPSDLRGPLVGDEPIVNAFYANRPGVSYRTWTSRLTMLPPKASRLVTVIASSDGVITMFGGPLSPQEPGDPSCQDKTASEEFWATHALSHESLAREG